MKFPLLDNLKRATERLLDCRIYRYSLPRGVDFSYDIRTVGCSRPVDTIFDVGAHEGESIAKFSRWFPNARYFCFEPVHTSLARLKERYGNSPHIELFGFGLGAESSSGTIHVSGNSTSMSSIVHPQPGSEKQAIEIDTLDRFCASHGVDFIDILKIDVEGYESEVIAGAASMLAQEKVAFLHVETELVPSSDVFVPLSSLTEKLDPYGYELFAIYDQVPDQLRKVNRLHFVNAVYVKPSYSKRGILPVKEGRS